MFSSTALFIVTKNGIFAATDGKAVEDGVARTTQKLSLVHDRILVSDIGLSDIYLSKKKVAEAIKSGQSIPEWVNHVAPYHFQTWILGIEKRTPRDVSVALLASAVKDEADRTFSSLAPLLKDMAMNHQPPFEGEKRIVAVYALAGFDETYIPTIYSVTLELDRNSLSLVPGKIEQIHPNPAIRVDDRFYMPAGSAQTAIEPIVRHPDSREYKRLPATAQAELQRLSKAEPVTISQIKGLLTALIAEEISASSQYVGWPVWFGVIPRCGRPMLTKIVRPRDGK